MLAASFFENMISHDRTDGSADDEADNDTSNDSTGLRWFFTFPKRPHTDAV